MSISQIFHGMIGIAEGVLLIVFRKKLSIALEKSFQKLSCNKINEQFYKLSYKVNPIYIAILGVIFIMIGVIAAFQ